MAQEISPQDWDQWARNPITQAFVRTLNETVEEAKEAWAVTAFTSEDRHVTARLNTVALAGVDMLRQVMRRIEDCKIVAVVHEGAENE